MLIFDNMELFHDGHMDRERIREPENQRHDFNFCNLLFIVSLPTG